jgi:hypothetical protein
MAFKDTSRAVPGQSAGIARTRPALEFVVRDLDLTAGSNIPARF